MANLQFVEAAVLDSADGVTFTKETTVDSEERKDALEAGSRPKKKVGTLAQQLADNQALADEEWQRKHNPFKPPAGLEEDDLEFLQQHEDDVSAKEKAKQAEAQQDLMQFHAEILANRVVKKTDLADDLRRELRAPLVDPTQNAEVAKLSGLLVVKKKKKKRKHRDKKEKKEKKREKEKQKRVKSAEAGTPSKAHSGAALNLLGGYSSGDDS